MWPFSKRGSRAGTPSPRPSDLPKFEEFEHSDAKLKVWLPQKLVDRINWLTVKLNVSRPDLIRGLIFDHIYGRVAYVALMALIERNHGQLPKATPSEMRPPSSHHDAIDQLIHGHRSIPDEDDEPMLEPGAGWIKFSVERQTVVDLEHLGKSDEDLTIMLPSRMKKDLQELASKHVLDASSYVRKLLVLQLLGEQVHGNWQAAVGAITADVKKLERD